MKRFSDEARSIMDACYYENILILVWGPGKPGRDAAPEKVKAYEKRVKIRNSLRKRFPNADVRFSEDPSLQKVTGGLPSQLLGEGVHIKASNIVVLLDIGRGPDLEIDHFVLTYSWAREKFHIFLPIEYKKSNGLVRDVYNQLRKDQVEYYTQDEFKRCDVATDKAVKAAHAASLRYYLSR